MTAHDQDAAPRQAGTTSEQRLDEIRARFAKLGIVVQVRELTPRSLGHSVRIQMGSLDFCDARFLDPQDAHDLAELLEHDAMEAVHASRSTRRG